MNCADVQRQLHAHSDGELDVVRHMQVEEHLTTCAACAEKENQLRSLRAAVSSPSLYYHAPAGLRARIDLGTPPVRYGRRRTLLQRPMIAAGFLLLIATSATVGMLLSRAGTSAEDQLAQWVVASHVRSLQVDHLADVVSTDQHTVKPWFRGKLDFSPEVVDLSEQGYALSGGRLDYLVNRPVVALIYHRRLHTINLFTWPAVREEEKAVRRLARQGFHIRYWQRSGMSYWAISDLNDQELDEFVRLFQEHTPELHP
jgi:anti-sigma factor RsiW